MNTPKYWWRVLDELRSNARMPLTELSSKTRIPVSSLHDQVKKHRKSYRLTALADFRKLGFKVWSLLFFTQDDKARNLVCPFLKGHGNVNNAFADKDQFVAEVVFRTEEEFGNFLAQLQHDYDVLKVSRMDIGEPLKREGCKLAELMACEPVEHVGRGW